MRTIKVAFKKGIFLREKELFFAFNIGALEYATKEILKIELWQIGEYLKDRKQFNGEYDLNIAVLYGAYYMACMMQFKKPKYKIGHAAMWYEYMSTASREEFALAFAELVKELKGEKKKKQTKK